MKSFNKVIATVVTFVFVSGLLPHWAFAQSWTEPQPGSAAGFNRSIFDYHFSRADRELNPDAWLLEARRGIGIALDAWEAISIDAFDSPLERDEYRRQIQKWSDEELEARFTQWLTWRFFGSEAENFSRAFSALVSDAQLRYTYHLGPDGNLLREDSTGDLRIIRPSDTERNFNDDLASWQEDSRKNITGLLASFEASVMGKYPELLAYIPDGEREIIGAAIDKAVDTIFSSLKLEFENIAAREERLFTGRRTGDIYSLRKKSDTEEASYITANLIEQARAICDEGIASLQTRIEEAANGEGDLVAMGTEWLEMYREQFERGLKIWEEAEERFFIRRVEWEQDSMRLFESGEEAWAVAFGQLEEERQKWELQAKVLFDSGETLFKQASVNLERAIALARAEFEYNVRIRTEAGASKVRALVDMYFTSVSAAYAAKENAEFWLRQYDSKSTADVTDASIYQWTESERAESWKRLEKAYMASPEYQADYKNLDKYRKYSLIPGLSEIYAKVYATELDKFNKKYAFLLEIRNVNAGKYSEKEKKDLLIKIRASMDTSSFEYLDEIEKSAGLYMSFYAKSLEMRDNLLVDYNGAFASGALLDILNDSSHEDIFLDEYQIALVRAKVLVKYWERRAEVATAVNAYAAELGAGRMTEAESMRQWENAKAEYEASIIAYEAEIGKLNSIGMEMQERNAALDAHIQRINEAAEQLDYLNTDYINFITLNSLQGNGILKEELGAKYAELLFEYKLIMDGGSTPFYLKELELAARIEYSQRYYEVDYLLDVLVNGDGEGYKSLAAIRNIADRIHIIDENAQILPSANDYGISPDDYRSELIDRLIHEYREKAQELPAAIDTIANQYGSVIRDLCLAAKREAEAVLAVRNMEIALFGDSSSADWYNSAWGKDFSDEEAQSISGLQFGEFLYNDLIDKYELLIVKRIQIETEALRYLLTGTTSLENEKALFESYCLVDAATAEKVLEALNVLSERMKSGENYTGGTDEYDQIIAWFLSGGSFYALSERYFSREKSEYLLANGLYEAYYKYGNACSFIGKEEWANMPGKLEKLFADYNIYTTGLTLPAIEFVGNIIFFSSGNYIQTTASLLKDVDALFYFAPSWLQEELAEWKECLINYMAVYAFANEYRPEKSSETYIGEIDRFDHLYDEINEFYDSPFAVDIRKAKKLNDSFFEKSEEETQLIYSYILTLAFETINAAADTNERHWRTYLSEKYLNSQEILSFAGNVDRGMMLDAIEWANSVDLRIQNAINTHLGNMIDLHDDDIVELMADYVSEVEKNVFHLQNYERLKSEIADLGKKIDYSMMPHGEFMDELDKRWAAVNMQENLFQSLKLEYFTDSQRMTEIGKNYNDQYTATKIFYSDMEDKRNAYDVQDAIRRWASTAYLDKETNDIDYCEERLMRANVVLDVLSGLYDASTLSREYGNSEYARLFAEYEQSYREMLLGAKVLNVLNSDLSRAIENNNALYSRYLAEIDIFGCGFYFPSDYEYTDEREKWNIKDMIFLADGKLAFSIDSQFKVLEYDQENLTLLKDYISAETVGEGEYHAHTAFQNEIAELGNRMAGYFKNQNKLTQWALARDFLVRKIASANRDIKSLAGISVRADMLKPSASLGRNPYMEGAFEKEESIGDYINGRQYIFNARQENAWNSLSDAEKSDLEFYVILTMLGDNSYSQGFSQFTVLQELSYAYNKVNDLYEEAKEKADWFVIGLFYTKMKDVNKATVGKIKTALNGVKDKTNAWQKGIIANIENILLYEEEYRKSCALVDSLQGEKTDENGIAWANIANTLAKLSKIDTDELVLLEKLWMEMEQENDNNYNSVVEAVSGLANWIKGKKENSAKTLEMQWAKDYSDLGRKEAAYSEAMEAYMEGGGDIAELVAAINDAYGPDAAAWKNHYRNIGQAMISSLTAYHEYGPGCFEEFSSIAEEYAALMGNSYGMGLMAELAAREAEWNEQRLDIAEKYKTWQETAGLILERGREDWKESVQKMLDSRIMWAENFKVEYERVSELWTEAYICGLEDKEQWLARAADVANNALGGAMLSAIGSDAERMSRVMDTREFSGLLSPDASAEAANVLAKLLESPGIGNMSAAFGAMSGADYLGAASVRRGTNMTGNWDAGNARLEAFVLSREANKAIAARESKRLAVSARNAANQALQMLADNVDSANRKFRASMDNMFIIQGQWNRSGDAYVKSIITGSTLFDPVLSEDHRVQGYKDYQVGPVDLKTRLDDEYLEGLESFALQVLVQNVYDEVNAVASEIFGNGESTEITRTVTEKKLTIAKAVSGKNSGAATKFIYEDIAIDLDPRYMGSGKFGEHIGYEPAYRPGGGTTRERLFYDRGKGELGRLMVEYIYWDNVEAAGVGEMYLAPWDKRMWDDTGSVFSAPSLHSLTNTVLQIGVAIASVAGAAVTGGMSTIGGIALMTAITSSGELVYNTLDVAYGYKGLDEAGFNFGKAVLINSVSAAGSGIFGGISNVAMKSVTGIAAETAMKVAVSTTQTLTTGLVSSAIGGITYNRADGLGYSVNAFASGMEGTVKSVLSSAVTNAATGIFTAVNSGNNMEKLGLHSLANKQNVQRLNGMLGSLAGQGMNYAMGEGFTLNMLNTSLLESLGIKTGGGNSGLLEFHVGQDGAVKMNIGAGGADVSPDTVWAATTGASVWGFDIMTDIYFANKDHDLKETFQAKYSFGDFKQKLQLLKFIFGIDRLVVNEEGEYSAETTRDENGKRVVTINGYSDDMSMEDKAYLAIMLGHEAYRDGYYTDKESQFNELKEAAIARTEMADRFNSDYGWLYETNFDLLIDSLMLEYAKQNNLMEDFDDYLNNVFQNDGDNYLRLIHPGGDWQNDSRYRNVTLLNERTLAQVNTSNSKILDAAATKIMQQKALDEKKEEKDYGGNIANFTAADGSTFNSVRQKLANDESFRKKYGVELEKHISLYLYGCMYFSMKYGIESITGQHYDTLRLNDYMRREGHYLNDSDLSSKLLEEVWNELAGGFYKTELLDMGGPIPDLGRIQEIVSSRNDYLVHIRVKNPVTGAIHSAMASDIEYQRDEEGRITGVQRVYVANPVTGRNSFAGKAFYTLNEIVRMDVYSVTPTSKFYKFHSASLGTMPFPSY